MSHKHPNIPKRIFIAVAISIVLLLGVDIFLQSRFSPFSALIHDAKVASAKEVFPSIDETKLTDTQKKIVALLQQEYKAQPPGTKYSNGVSESWCADFVSWIMNQAGVPFSNPNNGGWRIPGTYTLRDYFDSTGQFEKPGYQPKVGDVVLYDNPSPFGQHTNIVIKNDNGVLTTVGGNEVGKIHVQVHSEANDPGLVGYGRLQ